MKKLITFIMSFLMFMFFTTANAKEIKNATQNSSKNSAIKESKMELREIRKAEERNDVSTFSKDAFEEDFGNIPDVIWEQDPYYDIASFAKHGKKYNAFFDKNTSELVGTASNVTFADLPVYAQKEIKKHYKNYNVDRVIFYDNNEYNSEEVLLYGVRFENEDNYFAELSNKNGSKNIILQITPEGQLYYYQELHKKI